MISAIFAAAERSLHKYKHNPKRSTPTNTQINGVVEKCWWTICNLPFRAKFVREFKFFFYVFVGKSARSCENENWARHLTVGIYYWLLKLLLLQNSHTHTTHWRLSLAALTQRVPNTDDNDAKSGRAKQFLSISEQNNIWNRVYLHTYTYINIYICMHMYIYIYIHMDTSIC